MSSISLTTYTDMSGAATPSSGILLGLDLDGILKQKDDTGTITVVGTGGGGSGSSGTSGKSGSSGTSGTVGPQGADGANSFRWVNGSSAVAGEFDLTGPWFQSSNTVRINYYINSPSIDVSNWLSTLGTYVGINPDQAYLQITQANDSSNFVLYKVASGVDMGSWWEFDCNLQSSNGINVPGAIYTINWVTLGFGGTSGTSGSNGSSGTSGTSGSNGSSGTSGSNGSSGTSGANGSSGTSGTVGPSGTSGTSGTGYNINTILSSGGTLPIITSSSLPEFYGIDTSSAPLTLLLPQATTVVDGKIIYIKDIHGMASTNTIVINQFSGDYIEGSLSSYAINVDFGGASLIKQAGNWWLI